MFEASEEFPRLDDTPGLAKSGKDLWKLVAQWFVAATETLLRHDLIRDYAATAEFLRTKRGRISPLTSARSYYAGRIGLQCHFDEFNTDNPLNRLLKAAAACVVAGTLLEKPLRRRAAAVLTRMDEVGPLEPTDFRAQIDRRTSYYKDALILARHVIRAEGRSIRAGRVPVRTFLIRTPEMVEAGLRNLLREALCGDWHVSKRAIPLSGAKLTMNPDLVFDEGYAVADVKYKLLDPQWNRADLYQIVSFATAYQTQCSMFARPLSRTVRSSLAEAVNY